MIEVVYFSRSGNTRKVAEIIAEELGVTAKDVKTAGILPPDAFIFLGSGCYGAVLANGLVKFMEDNRFNGRKIALFTTSAFGSLSELALMKKQITNKGADIIDSFSCYGQLLLAKKGHPTQKELDNARKYARRVALNLAPKKSEGTKTASLAH
jgi:flavodoxin